MRTLLSGFEYTIKPVTYKSQVAANNFFESL